MATDENIRELCQRVINARDLEEFQATLNELRTAMREHFTGAGNLNAQILLQIRQLKEKKKDGTEG